MKKISTHVARRAYSAGELLAMRQSASEDPAVTTAIENLANEDGVRGKFHFEPVPRPQQNTVSAAPPPHSHFFSQPSIAIQHTPLDPISCLNICSANCTMAYLRQSRVPELRPYASPPSVLPNETDLSLLTSPAHVEHVLRGSASASFAPRSYRSWARSSEYLRPPSIIEDMLPTPPANQLAYSGQEQGIVQRPAANGFRPSPTPSIKKKKAEQIMREHGSPPGLRVTAGGRIVPSDMSPLCSPRYGWSAMKKLAEKGQSPFQEQYPPKALADVSNVIPNGFVALDAGGKLCQFVDGNVMPVKNSNGQLQLYIPAPNLDSFNPTPTGTQGPSVAPASRVNQLGQQMPVRSTSLGSMFGNTNAGRQTVPIGTQIQALEQEQGRKDYELKELERAEVLQRSSLTPIVHAQVIQQRRKLVLELDDIRKSLKELKKQTESSVSYLYNNTTSSGQFNYAPQPQSQQAWQPSVPSFDPYAFGGFQMPPQPQFGGMLPAFGVPYCTVPPQEYQILGSQYLPALDPSIVYASAYQPEMIPLPQQNLNNTNMQFSNEKYETLSPEQGEIEFNGHHTNRSAEQALAALSFNEGSEQTNAAPTTVSPNARRSHAIEIKDPRVDSNKDIGSKSVLNPTSPSYEPPAHPKRAKSPTPVSESACFFVPHSSSPVPSPDLAQAVRDHNNWIDERSNNTHETITTIRHRSSNSSIATADFFPRNPGEHSARHYSPGGPLRVVNGPVEKSSESGGDYLVTPKKDWHNSPWNPLPVDDFHLSVPNSAERSGSVAPPVTPVDEQKSTRNEDQDPLPHRYEMNMSPKSRRHAWSALTNDSVSKLATNSEPSEQDSDLYQIDSNGLPISSSEQKGGTATSTTGKLDLTNKSESFRQGYCAGLSRSPVGSNRSGDFLGGYCAGLMKSGNSNVQSLESPVVNIREELKTRSASQGSRASSRRLRTDRRESNLQSAPERNISPRSTLMQAVYDPRNENAILTPNANFSPTTEFPGFILDHQAKSRKSSIDTNDLRQLSQEPSHAQYTAPTYSRALSSRQTSASGIMGLQQKAAASVMSAGESHSGYKASKSQPEAVPMTRTPLSDHSGNQIASEQTSGAQRSRAASPSYFRQYPGNKLHVQQQEFKSTCSVAPTNSHASGWVSQYDGALDDLSEMMAGTTVTPVSGNAVLQSTSASSKKIGESRVEPAKTPKEFTESPKENAGPWHVEVVESTSRPSPKKTGSSPTKAKFDQIANKVGMRKIEKARAQDPEDRENRLDEDDPTLMSRDDKRRRRELWGRRFAAFRAKEQEEITKYREENPVEDAEIGKKKGRGRGIWG
ncbi:hypothetical protein BJ546DRAFT_1693 [Cryomyces antarcticus]